MTQLADKSQANPKEDIIVRMENLKKSFGNNHVLKGMNLKLTRGESLVILGRSGTGKSVLIKCIVKLIEADSGQLNVFRENILTLGDAELNEIRNKIGFLFQSGALYDSMTVRENLEFTVRRKLKKITDNDLDKMLNEVLSNVGLEGTIDKMPAELSGGMRKRISLARTLILKPELILYDEPTTGLDPITTREISNLMLDIQKKYKTSSIIITHDMDCARITSDRIMVIHDGKFIAEGSYLELKDSENEAVSSFFK